jgi:hypothetical protein
MLTDFNPFGTKTDSLLYSWDELLNSNNNNSAAFKSDNLELRLVDTDIGINSHQYSMYSQPVDLLTLSDSRDIDSLVSILQEVNIYVISRSVLKYTKLSKKIIF